MNAVVEKTLNNIWLDCFSTSDLENLLKIGKNALSGLIKRALAKGEIIQIRRGLYCLGEKNRVGKQNLFSIAQSICSPSYISFESALSYHGWIPETVQTVTSALAKRSRTFETPLGIFSFQKTLEKDFFIQVDRVDVDNHIFFMAQPFKAITDYIFVYRKNWTGVDPLIKSLRIPEDHLATVAPTQIDELEEYYHRRRLTRFFRGVRKDLNL